MAQNDLKPNHSSSEEDDDEEEAASGSEEEQTSGSDSDEVSDTDSGDKPNPEPKQALAAPPIQPPDLSSSETDESGSETDSDSDSPPKKSASVDASVKPISSMPMERAGRNVDSKFVKKDGTKTVATPPPAKSKRPPPSPAAIEKHAKKAKQSTSNGEMKKALVVSSQSANKSQAPDLSSSEPEESGSDTDSDLPPEKPAAVKPISSKPMEREAPNLESKSGKKSGSKTVSTPPPAKSKPPPAAVEKDEKKGKKNGATDDDTKKQLFQRLWSEDDEIVILEGMIDYKTERNGENPVADTGAFHEFIKKSLHVDVSRAQLVDKIRRLKKKYVNNASREKDGKDRSFSKSHEQKGYELSKLIWGSNSNSNNTSGTTESKKTNQSQKNGKLKAPAASTSTLTSNGVDDKDKLMVEVERNMDISRFVWYGGMNASPIMSDEIVRAGLELVDGSKRAELEGKWRKLKEQELVLYVKRMELLKEQAMVVLEAMSSSGN